MRIHDDVMKMRGDQVTRTVAWSKRNRDQCPRGKVRQARQREYRRCVGGGLTVG